MTPLIKQFLAARRASTPLLCIRTADPAATIKAIVAAYNGDAPAMLHWDIVRGISGVNKLGQQIGSDMGGADCIPPIDALTRDAKLPERSILFFANAHRVINENGVSQAIWNLRDKFKASGRTLVLLCPMLDLPSEIAQDVLTLDEPLPTIEQLAEIARDIYRSADLKPPDDETLVKATDATCGLAAFPAEQVLAMSITKSGLDMEALWERKKQVVEQTKGLAMYRGGVTFAQIRGCKNVIHFMTMTMEGEESPRIVVWIDEAEKQFAGAGTDTSGVSTEMVGTFLTWMEELQASGILLIGAPGCAKSMVAKATGTTFGKPTISFDVGAMKGSLVGESNAAMRNALKVVDAIGQGRVLVIATCNSFGSLSPEMRRRFKDATFYFDPPTKEEAADIWQLYISDYKLKPKQSAIPPSDGWTGAEIKQCCKHAWNFRCTLTEAAQFIVPVCKSGADQIERLREQANGKFISASYPGVYQKQHEAHAQQAATSRRLEI